MIAFEGFVKMKYLVNSEAEYLAIFSKLPYNKVEHLLGLDFAFVDGSYLDNTDDDTQDVSKTIWRTTKYSILPESYPCIVHFIYDNDFDRIGSFTCIVLELFYPSDFSKERSSDFIIES